MLEYRNKAGDYEISLPSSGLLVYRINPGAGRGNASGPPDEVYLYRPGGSLTVEGSLGSAALGISSRTAISDYTNPYAFLWNNGEADPAVSIFQTSPSMATRSPSKWQSLHIIRQAI